MTTYTYFNFDYPLAIGDTFAQGINNRGILRRRLPL
jgi:hypothetical protein